MDPISRYEWALSRRAFLRNAGMGAGACAFNSLVAQAAGTVFALGSLLTPFFLGTIAGAIASGRVPADGGGGP